MSHPSHLNEDEVDEVAHVRLQSTSGRWVDPGARRVVEHLAECERCADLVGLQEQLIMAARVADRHVVGHFEVPPFDTVLLPHLGALTDPAADAARTHRGGLVMDRAPVVISAPGFSVSWRLAATLVARQARLIPWMLVPLSLLALAAAVVVAVATPTPPASVRVLTVAVSVVALAGGAAVCSTRWDPRRELLQSMTLSPAAVFVARLVLVLLVDLLAATFASLVTAGLQPSLEWREVVLGWLGPALLSASTAIVFAVWRSVWVGCLVGLVVWIATAVGTPVPAARGRVGLGALGSSWMHWTTSSPLWTVLLSVLLLGVAVRIVASAPLRPVGHSSA